MRSGGRPAEGRKMRRVALVLLIIGVLLASPLLAFALIGADGRAAVHAWLMDDTPPPAPDYAQAAAWAALPDREDAADHVLVPGSADQQASAAADVFFLHAGANWTLRWNAPIDHWLVRFLVDGALLEQWASAFTGCCRVYAPRFPHEAGTYPAGHEA